MPWQEVSTMSLRQEFVALAQGEGANIRALCQRFGISPKTGYKWLRRAQAGGAAALVDRSRRPQSSPRRTSAAIEAAVVAARQAHPAWGGRKLHHWLRQAGLVAVPSPSTITAILRRHGLLEQEPSGSPRAWQRFEHVQPNDLWQIDFTGPWSLGTGSCSVLSVLDDHSRFLLGLRACRDQQAATVRAELAALFARYGRPWRILVDNGSPWGAAGEAALTAVEVWFLSLDILVSHGRPYHPQTQGKVERFHGTLAAEVGRDWSYPDQAAAQAAFDRWRTIYNQERPHDALGMQVPASRYQVSSRPFPLTVPAVVYGPDDLVRTVQTNGTISYRNRAYRVGRGLRQQRVALRRTTTDEVWDVYFGRWRVGVIDARGAVPPQLGRDGSPTEGCVTHVSEHPLPMSPV